MRGHTEEEHMGGFDVIAFDADDTLWHNETLYLRAQTKLKQLLSKFASPEAIERELRKVEVRNLDHYGYGIKSYALSMIETAITLSEGRIQGTEVQAIIGIAREMLDSPVELFEHAEEAVVRLSKSHALMIVTKGDLLDQETKVARSGLAGHFSYIEVVSDKTSHIYHSILTKYHIAPQRFLMVGNSLKSDILPVVALGAQAVYVPYQLTWAHELVDNPDRESGAYFELEHIGLLPAMVRQLDGG